MYAKFLKSTTLISLSDDSQVQEDMSNVRDGSGKSIQEVVYTRGTSGKTYDRGNEFTRLNWEMAKLFTSADAAMTWLNNLRISLRCVGLDPANGTFQWFHRTSGGGFYRYDVANANVTVRASRFMNLTLFVEFEMTGGAITGPI